jgi:hypothetical protein
MRSWETLHVNTIFHPQTPHTTSSSSPPLLLVVQIILMSYPTDDARHPPTRTKLSSTTNTYPFIIIQQLPVLATFTPALNAKHSLEYSLPSHPQTGSYNSMQTCWSTVGVQVGPAEQDVVQELEAVCTTSAGLLVGCFVLVRSLRAAEAEAESESADAIAVSTWNMTMVTVVEINTSAIFMMPGIGMLYATNLNTRMCGWWWRWVGVCWSVS